ncbi:MAG: GNAT family N-acetyltransferase [Alphaproteobacteria bacterium]|nr:GNAT family N-acetyltransferase [Alphaproteobacteria bacterium]
MTTAAIRIAPPRFPDDTELVRQFFTEYVDRLGIDLSFQDVDTELASLPGKYAPPQGAVLLARDDDGKAVGVVALRPLPLSGACEMKRLYVRPQARAQKVGRRLAEAIVNSARTIGYARILLDTLPTMQAAVALYASLGFRPIEPYYPNPIPGTVYLALDL